MSDFFGRFLTFDKLIATGLIKVLYWIGVIGIVLFTIVAFFASFGSFGHSFMLALGRMIAAPLVGLISLIVWRFLCEVYLVVFGIYDRLGNIQEAVGGGAAKDVSSVAD